jgi:hypothetical protein
MRLSASRIRSINRANARVQFSLEQSRHGGHLWIFGAEPLPTSEMLDLCL